jgi:hypothetical protein
MSPVRATIIVRANLTKGVVMLHIKRFNNGIIVLQAIRSIAETKENRETTKWF